MLDVDIHALADTCVRLDVPVEINMLDFASILAHNHQSFAERYLFSYRTLIDNGVQVVLGSDWHNLTAGEPTAFLPAMLLGVKPRDMRFLEQWLGPRPG
jgi:predicted amidohydrolase YtcJ